MTAQVESNTVSSNAPSSSGATYTGNRGSVANSTKDAVKSAKKSGQGKKNKGVKKSDVVDRYKEVEDALDDVTDALEDTRKEFDRLYGAAQIANLKK
jgi:hypothetical protein